MVDYMQILTDSQQNQFRILETISILVFGSDLVGTDITFYEVIRICSVYITIENMFDFMSLVYMTIIEYAINSHVLADKTPCINKAKHVLLKGL